MPLSDEDVGLLPTSKAVGGGLSDEDVGLQSPTATADFIRAIPTAMVKGAAHIPGFAGDIASLGQSMSQWVGDKFGPRVPEGVPQIGRDDPRDPRFAAYYAENPLRQKVDLLAYGLSPSRVLPTGENISEAILSRTGSYEPQTPTGRILSEGVEFGTSMLGPGGAIKAVEGAGPKAAGVLSKYGKEFANLPTRVRDAVVGFSSGLGSGTAGEWSRNVEGEESPWAKIAGAIAGGSLPSGLQKTGRAIQPLLGGSAAEKSAERAAGTVLTTSATDPDAARAALENIQPTNIRLSSSQVANDPGLAAAEERLSRMASRQDNASELALPRQQREAANVQALTEQADKLGGRGSPLAMEQFQRTQAEQADEAVRAARGELSTGMTRGEASAEARAAFDKAMDAEKKAADKLWQDQRLSDTAVDRSVFFTDVSKYVDDLDPITRRQIPANVRDSLLEYAEKYANSATIPMEAAQKIRSQVLELARDASSGANPNKAEARALSGLANQILGTLEGPAAIAPKDRGAIEAWKSARDATRQFHEKFTAGILGRLDDVDTSGVRRVVNEATLNQIIGKVGSGSEVKLDQFLKAAGPDAEKPITEYMTNLLFANGSKEPTAKQIEKFASDYSHVLERVPGLDDKVHALYDSTVTREGVRGGPSSVFAAKSPENAVMSVLRASDPQAAAVQLMGQLTKAGDTAAIEGLRRNTVDTMLQQAKSPQDILSFLNKYEKPVGRILNEPHHEELLRALRENIQSTGRKPVGKVGSMSGMKALEGGRFIDLLLGDIGGKVAGAGVGVGVAKLLEAAVPGAGALGSLVEVLGAAGGLKYGEKALSAGPYGKTQQKTVQILSKAFEDPKYAALLMKKATPANWQRLEKSAAPLLTAAQSSQENTRKP